MPFARRTPEVICLPYETRRDDRDDAALFDASAFGEKPVEEAVFEEIRGPEVSVFKKTKRTQKSDANEALRFDRPIFLAERAPDPLASAPAQSSPDRAEKAHHAPKTKSAPSPKPASISAATPAKSGWSPSARLMALLAIIAVPAVAAAPQKIGQLPGDAPTEAEMVSAKLREELARNPAMPFEKPGMSFPGSAFFFLADPPSDALIALPTTDALLPETGEAGHELGQVIDAGPGANPFFTTGGTDHMRASNCLAQAIWYEAASESEAGKRAVAQVVLNRVAHPGWPGSVCGVVYQGSNRSTGCQFTFTCDGSLKRPAKGRSWDEAQRIANEALSGKVYAPIGHATHYHTLWVNPYWASSLDHVGTIGAHRFYRNRGAGGKKGAFTQRYAGIEPGVNARVTAAPLSEIAPDPMVRDAAMALPAPSARHTPSGNAAGGYQIPAVPAQAVAGPGAVRTDPHVSGVGQVREDYSRAGQWKSDAARKALLKEKEKRANTPPQGSSEP
ncbi:cell wall hydrolase [Erythrobacter sp. SCSIO 43205]|uniref:cell wall hydrolase n=1 Tax=Erythrobacter sp. SCSIO 43205 TaxID=2779361 RepID=UPI00210235A5|nr:cell wall hydrolase [Erythrobacter sp. SCSIO 43205]